jgi:predicted RNA-binding protein YlqC (UPF0109 family)
MKTKEIEIEESLEPLMHDVIGAFIGHPEELEIECTRMGGLLVMKLIAHPDDNPKIVGKGGKNLAALNALFAEIARRMHLSIKISVPDRDKTRQHPNNRRGFENNPNWPRADFFLLLKDVLRAICSCEPDIREQINPRREMRLGINHTFTIEESSIIHITPAYADLPVFKPEVEIALEVLFRAIGQQQGRRIIISFTNVSEQTE